jgi:hypothetical protein
MASFIVEKKGWRKSGGERPKKMKRDGMKRVDVMNNQNKKLWARPLLQEVGKDLLLQPADSSAKNKDLDGSRVLMGLTASWKHEKVKNRPAG